MALGISTYAYVWRREAMTLEQMLDDAHRLGCDVFQICDAPELESLDAAGLDRLAAHAGSLGLRLETGTKGTEPEHLLRHLDIARALGARLVRSMLSSAGSVPGVDEAIGRLRAVIPAFAAAGVTLGLETYEQVRTDDLVRIVRAVDDRHLGIVLDPGNSVARLEHPSDVISRTAPYVVNLHVKDFAFTRREGGMGFTVVGAPLGTGLLDYDAMTDVLELEGRDVTHVIEHWLDRQGTPENTRATEAAWIQDSVHFLRARERC